MLIALTLLDGHFDALLLEHSQETWQVIDHNFLPITSLPQLYKKWQQQSRHIAIGLDRSYCYYHQFNISQHIKNHELEKYITLNAKQFFSINASQLVFNFERHNLNHEFDKVHCIASRKKSIHHIIKKFRQIGFRIRLIDSSVNALIRGFLQQQKPREQCFAIVEQHQNGSHTFTQDPNASDKACEKIYRVTESIAHQPGSLTTYGLALNAHLN